MHVLFTSVFWYNIIIDLTARSLTRTKLSVESQSSVFGLHKDLISVSITDILAGVKDTSSLSVSIIMYVDVSDSSESFSKPESLESPKKLNILNSVPIKLF